MHTHNFVCNSPNTSFLGRFAETIFKVPFFLLVILKKKNLRRCSTFHYIHGIIWSWDIDSCISPKKSFLRSLSKNDGLREIIQIMNFNGRKITKSPSQIMKFAVTFFFILFTISKIFPKPKHFQSSVCIEITAKYKFIIRYIYK